MYKEVTYKIENNKLKILINNKTIHKIDLKYIRKIVTNLLNIESKILEIIRENNIKYPEALVFQYASFYLSFILTIIEIIKKINKLLNEYYYKYCSNKKYIIHELSEEIKIISERISTMFFEYKVTILKYEDSVKPEKKDIVKKLVEEYMRNIDILSIELYEVKRKILENI